MLNNGLERLDRENAEHFTASWVKTCGWTENSIDHFLIINSYGSFALIMLNILILQG